MAAPAVATRDGDATIEQASRPPRVTVPPVLVVVDDDDTIRHLVRAALEDEGYDVVTAPNGSAALAAVAPATGRRPALILLDMHMPVMNGWEFACAYRDLPGPHAPIVVLTAGGVARECAGAVGAAAYLGKPFDLDDLIACVGRLAPR